MVLRQSAAYVKKKMGPRYSLFAKMNILILVLFIPIIILFTYSNEIATSIISKELRASNIKQLSFLSSQIDSRINQTVDFVITFSKDPNVEKFNGLNIWDDLYDRMQTKYVVQEKMMLQSGITTIWPVTYTVYSQQNKEAISNNKDTVKYDEAYLNNNMTGEWTYGDGRESVPDDQKSFHWFYTDSFGHQGALKGSNLVVHASFGHENIENMLDTYKAGGQGDPIFYRKGEAPILNRSASKELAGELVGFLDGRQLGGTEQEVVRLDSKNYLVSAVKSPQLNWYLVDIVPLDQMLGPISFSRNLFYLSMALLFAVGISASVLLYRNVQRPIIKLIRGLQSVQRGDFSVQIKENVNNEFAFLFYRFNEMSRQIQDLVEKVLGEKLRAREATLKQLQAQINPHFLYNCLGYIINMAQMKEEEAVVSMAYNLSAYYRYTTRMERQTGSVEEEIKLIVNYLDIQKLRNERIYYTIDIPNEMLKQQVPRLLIQPVVENAVLHGVGKSYSSGEIRIRGEVSGGLCKIYIDDDGPGMNPEQQDALNRKMKEPLQEEMGCGLWNTNQRIMHQFGDGSYLHFTKSPLGGFRTEIIWQMPIEEEKRYHPNIQGDPLHAIDHSR
ncbi:sensor histidine kinase [Paenibacillus sp. LPE1-1-1.1]|uniref:sensor histidine kinase n=1 Tax=Paenibacillus sp. LPE1-1-1.1 TaxID=3135230 RepID=UPI003431807C